MSIRTLLLATGLAAAGVGFMSTAAAQTLSKPVEFYFEPDANTVKPVIAIRATGDAATEQLLKRIARDPRAKAEHAQLAHIAMEGGRIDLGRELYARALARIDATDALWRPTMWNYGWDLFRAGDAAGALEQWSRLQATRGVTASWVPPTYALALWTLGRKDEAVVWYAAAVRTEPQQWNTSAQYATLLPQWRDSERATLAEVQAAWAANPPSWP